MNNINRFIAGAAALAALASCDLNKTPEFDDAKAFVSFEVTNYSYNEDNGTIKIPVTIASLEPIRAVIGYEVKGSQKDGDGLAKEGVDYRLADELATLTFDGKTRTQNIEIELIDRPKFEQGDLTFSIDIVNAGKLALGEDTNCNITIVDLDHPLAPILGEYSVTAGSSGWSMTLMKDSKNKSLVWIDGF